MTDPRLVRIDYLVGWSVGVVVLAIGLWRLLRGER